MDVREEVVATRTESTAPVASDSAEVSAFKAQQIIWYIAGLINALLLLRLVFLLLGARSVGFAAFLYDLTRPLVAPFRGIFPAPAADGSYFDTAALVAIIVYSLIAWGISALVDISRRPRPVL